MGPMLTRDLDTAIRDTDGGKLYLFLVNPEERLEANLTALKKAVNYEKPFIYIMARYPYPKLQGALDELGALDGTNSFIDAKTKTISQDVDLQQKQVMYMKSPQNLVNVSTSISVASQDMEQALVVIDSLSTLNSYNTIDDVASFLENVRERLQTLGSNALIFQDFREGEWPPEEVLEYVDEVFSLYEGELESCALREKDGGYVLDVPSYIVESLGWDAGEALSIRVVEDGIRVEEE
ncbi:MAG: hypothetical protein SVU32_00185 [Candidatus Nanohaloarchaea archaeon]|nr:hypothetical protein [Candidatus Nanohaloarchaea archaeon]